MADDTQNLAPPARGPVNPSVAVFETPLGRVEYNNRSALFQQVGVQMLKGAGYAAIAFFVPVLFILAIWGLGKLLPDESKQAPDPSLETTHLVIRADADAA